MKVKSQSEVAQSCPTPSDPMDCSLPGSSVHGIFQARVLEWDAIAFSSQSHQPAKSLLTTGGVSEAGKEMESFGPVELPHMEGSFRRVE